MSKCDTMVKVVAGGTFNMKKFLFITVILVLALTGCSFEYQPGPDRFEPITVNFFDELEIEVITHLEVHSMAFTEQGVLIPDEYWYGSELLAILADLEIDLPPVIGFGSEFEFQLVAFEFEYAFSEHEDYWRRLPWQEGGCEPGVVNNPDCIYLADWPYVECLDDQLACSFVLCCESATPYIFNFTDAGRYTIEISHAVPRGLVDDWRLSEAKWRVDVVVTGDLETGSLVAVVEPKNVLVFENVFVLNVSDDLQTTLVNRWEERVTAAYEAGFMYVANGHDDYVRTPIRVVAGQAFPEDYATTISNSDAMSYIALVNRNWALRSDFSPNDLSVVQALNANGAMNSWISLRATAARAMENLINTAYYEDGHVLLIISGYRSFSNQQTIHANQIARRGVTEARRWSARAGHSEHQLGLAMDLSTFGLGGSLSQNFSSTPEGTWVRDNAHRFGFIVRYQNNREADTGYAYEPWHLRYVGVQSATAIFNGNLILEEYLGRW